MSEIAPRDDDYLARLEQTVVDPYIAAVYGRLIMDAELYKRIPSPRIERATIGKENKLWPYHDHIVTVSGTIYDLDNDGNPKAPILLDGTEAISYGFRLAKMPSGYIEVGHALGVCTGPDRATPMFAPLDSTNVVELPFPSDELRANRFAIEHDALARQARSAAEQAVDPDQIPAKWAHLVTFADIATPEGSEHCRDMASYLMRLVEFNTNGVPYNIEFGEGACSSSALGRQPVQPNTGLFVPDKIIVAPIVLGQRPLGGREACIPYIEGGFIASDAPRNTDAGTIAIPCRSIRELHSVYF